MSGPNRNIFREYDIRGIADRDMPDSLAEDLGRALGTFQRAWATSAWPSAATAA
jgi:phosphomannomutase